MIKSAATKAFDFPTSDSLSISFLLNNGKVSLPEEELTIQVRYIDSIHINYVNIPETS
jgi:hypothetical protein